MYASINDPNKKIIPINEEKTICLNISIFIFSLLLSLTIDLYNLNPLTASASIQGIYIKFCKKIAEKANMIPLPFPNVAIKADTV